MVMFTISRDQALIIREFNDPPVSFYILELNNPTMVELRVKSIYLAGIRAQIQVFQKMALALSLQIHTFYHLAQVRLPLRLLQGF